VDGKDHPVSIDLRRSLRALWTDRRVALQFDYRPFGALDAGNSRLADPLAGRVRIRYAGQQFDAASGLYNDHARLYDPELARFLAPDPAGQGASPYAYVGNDPVNAIDPSGAWLARVVKVLKKYFLLDDQDILRFTVNDSENGGHNLASGLKVLSKNMPWVVNKLVDNRFIHSVGGVINIKGEELWDWMVENAEDGTPLLAYDMIQTIAKLKRVSSEYYNREITVPNLEQVNQGSVVTVSNSISPVIDLTKPTRYRLLQTIKPFEVAPPIIITNAPGDASWQAFEHQSTFASPVSVAPSPVLPVSVPSPEPSPGLPSFAVEPAPRLPSPPRPKANPYMVYLHPFKDRYLDPYDEKPEWRPFKRPRNQ